MSETQRPHSALRRTGAVLAGVAAVVVLSIGTDQVMHAMGVFPPSGQPMGNALFMLAAVYRIVYGVAGSYIAARLAPDQPMKHALAVGVVGLVASIAGAAATRGRGPEFGPSWYPLALVATALPCAWAGGRLHAMRSGPR